MLDNAGSGYKGVVAVNIAAPADIVVAANYATMHDSIVMVVDPSLGPDPADLEWLRHSAGQIDQIVVVDTTDALPAGIGAAFVTETCGPLGYSSGPLPNAS
jgi:hypothetical protein